MEALELFAVILATLILVKIAVILINPRIWFAHVVKPIYGNPLISGVIFLALLVWTGSTVLARYSIVEVLAILLPLTFLIMLGILPFSKKLLPWYEDMATPDVIRKAWLSTLVWAVLAIWAFYAVFFT